MVPFPARIMEEEKLYSNLFFLEQEIFLKEFPSKVILFFSSVVFRLDSIILR